MNINWVINMVMRRVVGRLVSRGVDAGFRAMSQKGGNAKGTADPQTAAAQAERDRIRAIRQARRDKRQS